MPPGAAGYSGTPQARKLGLKPGQRVGFDSAPHGWDLADPPDGLRLPDADGGADVIIAFFRARSEIAARLPALSRRIFPDGAVWAAWPRRSAGHVSDITDNDVRRHALDLGLVDVKVAAIDEDWSGIRLVWRVENRRRLASFRENPVTHRSVFEYVFGYEGALVNGGRGLP